jgi:hypothetical protein
MAVGDAAADMSAELTGGCLCGGVRFELTEPPHAASYCHCKRCQRRSGTAASPQVRVAPGTVRLLSGEELVRWYAPPDGFPKAFCSNCGSALFSRPPDGTEPTSVRFGTFDGDPGIRPQWHQFVDYAAVWEPIPDDGLPRYPEGKPA